MPDYARPTNEMVAGKTFPTSSAPFHTSHVRLARVMVEASFSATSSLSQMIDRLPVRDPALSNPQNWYVGTLLLPSYLGGSASPLSH